MFVLSLSFGSWFTLFALTNLGCCIMVSPYDPPGEIDLIPKLVVAPKPVALWPFLAWAALGPVAIVSLWMFIPYAMPSLQKALPFLRGDIVMYLSLIAGFLPAAVVSF